MIAFALRETGRDPAWLIGAPVPQLGSNAGLRRGLSGRRGATSPIAPSSRCRRRSRWSRTSSSTTTPNMRPSPSSRTSSNAGSRASRTSFATRRPTMGRSASRGSSIAGTPAPRWRRSSSPACLATPRPPLSGASAARAAGSRSTKASLTIVDDYAHHPTEIAVTIAAARERFPGRTPARALPAASLLAHTAPRRGARRSACGRGRRDRDGCLRRARAAGRRRHRQARGRCAQRPGVLAAYTPTVEQGAARLARLAQPGDVVLVVGAGDIDRAVGLLRR